MRAMRWGSWALALLLAGAVSAGELAGVRLPDRTAAEGKDLVLNGMGLRKAYAVAKVYVAGLYLERKSASADEILGSSSVRKIVLHFVRDVSREQITGAWSEGFEKNAGPALPGLRERIVAHAEVAVRRNLPQRLVPESQQDDVLVDRRVGLVRTVDAKARNVGAAGEPERAHVRDGRLARAHGSESALGRALDIFEKAGRKFGII